MIIKFKPIAIDKIWGGNSLSKIYDIDKPNIGEIWGISAHSSYSNVIIDGKYKGLTLRELYEKHRDLFGNIDYDEFPILFKVIDAAEDLSIQVHPDDLYANKYENSNGKDECWYILDTRFKNTDIIIGHNAKSKETLIQMINNDEYDKLLNRFPIKPNDYFYISSGKIHAITKGTMLLEVSQSSDITYRLYDYNRLDKGKLRQLHIEKSVDVINAPDTKLKKIHLNKHFTFNVKENNDTTEKKSHQYGDYYYIIKGKGYIDNKKVLQGDFLMITAKKKYILHGNFKYAYVNIIHI